MRRLALLMIFSIVATMTFGCGKTEGEEKSTKEEVTTIQETEEPLETKENNDIVIRILCFVRCYSSHRISKS